MVLWGERAKGVLRACAGRLLDAGISLCGGAGGVLTALLVGLMVAGGGGGSAVLAPGRVYLRVGSSGTKNAVGRRGEMYQRSTFLFHTRGAVGFSCVKTGAKCRDVYGEG